MTRGVLAAGLAATLLTTTAAASGTTTQAQAHASTATTSAAATTSEVIHTTANHPWLTADRGWVHAGDLRAGERVLTLPGVSGSGDSTATVTAVRMVAGTAEMDNLTVAQEHTYAVGAARAVVHNSNAGELCGETATGETIDLYHGTNAGGAADIRANGIDLSAGRSNLDFGRGFYTTRDPEQAAKWAASRYGDAGTVLQFRVPASMFDDLSGKVFPEANDEYLNMVRLMRTGGPMHPYDYVEGPLLGNPRAFLAGEAPFTFGNQISFHTEPAVSRLFGYLLP